MQRRVLTTRKSQLTKNSIFTFCKKGNPEITKNYRCIPLTVIADQVYNVLLLNRIRPEVVKILRKNLNGFRRNRSKTSQILTIRWIIEGVRAKNLEATILIVDFCKPFYSIPKGKMKQILLAYGLGLPKENITAIMMLHKKTKVMIRSPNSDTDLFDIVPLILQRDTLASFIHMVSH